MKKESVLVLKVLPTMEVPPFMEMPKPPLMKKIQKLLFVVLPALIILGTLPAVLNAQELTKKDTADIRFVNARKFFIYKVQKGETMFSISQKFKIPQEEIRQFNPELDKSGLQVKMKLWIPAYSWLKKADTETQVQDKEEVHPEKDMYSISLFTHLNLSRIYLPGELPDSTLVSEPVEKEVISNLEFYEGLKRAVDVLKWRGFKVKLKIYDLDPDSDRIGNFLTAPELASSDLIVTNENGADLRRLNEYSKKHKIRLLASAINVTEQVKSNPLAIAMFPSSLLQCRVMASRMANLFPQANCVIVRTGQVRENERAGIFRQGWLEDASSKTYMPDFGKNGFKAIRDSLVKGKNNLLFIPSSNEDMVSGIFNSLKEILGDYEITVVGLPTWQYFETIDPALFDSFHVYWFNSGYIDDKNLAADSFRKYFRDTYSTEPGEAAYQGYDAMMLAGENFLKYGRKWLDGKKNLPLTGLYSSYDLLRISENTCLENKTIHVFHFQDYLVVNVKE